MWEGFVVDKVVGSDFFTLVAAHFVHLQAAENAVLRRFKTPPLTVRKRNQVMLGGEPDCGIDMYEGKLSKTK